MAGTERFTQMIDATDDRILIMGAGNTVMGDEGVGPRCVEELMAHFEFPSNVELMDAGTMGLSPVRLRPCRAHKQKHRRWLNLRYFQA